MKKIVIVIESLGLGGAERCLVSLLNNLDYNKLSVDLILFAKEGFFLNMVPKEVNVLFLEMPPLNIIERLDYKVKKVLGKKYHNAQHLWNIIKDRFSSLSGEYDIAIAYNQGFATYFTACYIRAKKRFSWLNINYRIAGYNLDYDIQYYSKFEKVICVSEEVETEFQRMLRNNGYKGLTEVVTDLIDDIQIKQKSKEVIDLKLGSNKINIVTTGRLAKQKGIDLAIEACALLVKNKIDINWYVLGEGAERGKLQKMIDAYNLSDRFFLLGAFTNPYPILKQADLYAQTSRFEGLGTALIEAVILSRPCVATNFASAYSILENGKYGLIATQSPLDIAEKIEQLLTDKRLKNQIENNLLSYNNKYNKNSIDQFYKLIECT